MREREKAGVVVALWCFIVAVQLVACMADAQPASLNLNGQPLTAVLCDGGVVCSRRGSVATIIVTASGGTGGTSDFDGGYNVVEDEGVPLTKRTTLNMVGSSVTCADTGGKTVCTFTGGGGSVNTASGVASFDGGTLDTLTTVTAAWASGASVITCVPTGEEASVEGLITTVLSQAAGSFVVRAEPRNGSHWGTLPFVCLGN